jgi:hypothetical protein
VAPGYLTRQSLLGEHHELHGIVSVHLHGKRGYANHPETLALGWLSWVRLRCAMDGW